MHLLVVEDDLRLARTLSRLLRADRHVVETAVTGEAALDLGRADIGVEVIILDLGLPDIDGLEVARRLRGSGSKVPILVLTARDAIADRVAGLDAGADDYLVKPFAYPELSARLRALGRRSLPQGTAPPLLTAGTIELDDVARDVRVANAPVELSPREFAVLEALLRHPDQALSREQLLDLAWPIAVAVTHNSVDAYVSLLRRKLGAESTRLETVRGIGYRLSTR